MKKFRATISILTLAAACSLMTDALAADCRPYRGTEHSPFVIGFEADRTGTKLTPVLYPVLKILNNKPVLGKAIDPTDEKYAVREPIKINGARCAHKLLSVSRYWNHELYILIDIGWGFPPVRWDIDHGPHPHPE